MDDRLTHAVGVNGVEEVPEKQVQGGGSTRRVQVEGARGPILLDGFQNRLQGHLR